MKMTNEYVSRSSSHIGIAVPDMEEALRFYRDLLGFEEVWRLHVDAEMIGRISAVPGAGPMFNHTVQLLVPGGSRIELQAYEPHGKTGGHRMNDQGFNHLAFSVADVQAEYERLKAAGVNFRAEPVYLDYPGHPIGGYMHVYFDDPWGLTLQLLGPAPGANPVNDERLPA